VLHGRYVQWERCVVEYIHNTSMPEHIKTEHEPRKGRVSSLAQTTWVSAEYVSVNLVDALQENLRMMLREADLFIGVIFTLLGLLNWSSAKYCDGNTSDYLSCTRPATYYYYGALEITLIIVGVLLVVIWALKQRKTR
jgi:hypothetical protein